MEARHTKIEETFDTSEGILVRESYFEHPKGVSNVYMIGVDGIIKWEAELPMQDDCYANPIRLAEHCFRCCTWMGGDCRVSLETGEILDSRFTK